MPRVEEEIKQDVVDQLAWDDRVDAAQVQVLVQDATVVLTGNVHNYWARRAAVEDAQLIPGVLRIEDELVVRWPPVDTPTDDQLWDEVDRTLRANPNIDATRITVDVTDGTVSLEGNVDAFWKTIHAERIVSDITGIRGVRNRLAIVPTHSIADENIATQIVGALKRNALVDSERIDVRVVDGVVTLEGAVPNWPAASAVRNAAHYTPGVVNVRDNLVLEG